MPTGTIGFDVTLAGISCTSVVTRTESGQISHEVALPAAKAGTLSTRTDNEEGTATLGAGHGIETSDLVDIYWSGGCRRGVTVGTVDGTSVPFGEGENIGAGDNLPTQDTAIFMAERVPIDTDFDGDLVEMIAVHSTKRCQVDFEDSDDASLTALELAADEVWTWIKDQPASNPLTGNPVDQIQATSGLAEAATLKIGVLYDSA